MIKIVSAKGLKGVMKKMDKIIFVNDLLSKMEIELIDKIEGFSTLPKCKLAGISMNYMTSRAFIYHLMKRYVGKQNKFSSLKESKGLEILIDEKLGDYEFRLLSKKV